MRTSGGSYVCSFEKLAWVAGQELNLILSLDACDGGLLYPFELTGHRHVTACRRPNMKRLSLIGKSFLVAWPDGLEPPIFAAQIWLEPARTDDARKALCAPFVLRPRHSPGKLQLARWVGK